MATKRNSKKPTQTKKQKQTNTTNKMGETIFLVNKKTTKNKKTQTATQQTNNQQQTDKNNTNKHKP